MKTFVFLQPLSPGRASSVDFPERSKGLYRDFYMGTVKTRREHFKHILLAHLQRATEGSEGYRLPGQCIVSQNLLGLRIMGFGGRRDLSLYKMMELEP